MSIREGKHRKPVHLAANFPSVSNTPGWNDAQSGSQIEFESHLHLAQTAERGLFDFFFLTDGLRLREHHDSSEHLDVVGGPDTFTMLAALAGVTERIGLVGTVDMAFNEPFEVARQLATLDHLSDGRAGCNMVTTPDAFTGANFRRGGYLDRALNPALGSFLLDTDRYRRAGEFLDVVRQFWDSWDLDAVVADDAAGIYVDPSRVHTVRHAGAHFEVRGMATLPAGPQGHPVLLQASGEQASVETDRSGEGRDFGAAQADALFTLHSTLEAGQRYYADVKARAVAHGRDPERLKVFPAATFVLGDNAADAADRARHIREQQVSPQTGREQFEQLVGTPDHVAAEIDRYVQSDACDGFILVPHLTPHGLDGFVDTVVPLLQERGVFRTEYTGETLRDHLGLTG